MTADESLGSKEARAPGMTKGFTSGQVRRGGGEKVEGEDTELATEEVEGGGGGAKTRD